MKIPEKFSITFDHATSAEHTGLWHVRSPEIPKFYYSQVRLMDAIRSLSREWVDFVTENLE